MDDDLISRKAVFELIDSKAVNGALMYGEKLMIDGYGLMDEVSDLPTAYNVDKVVEQLSCCEGSCNGRNAYKDCEEGCAGCINCKISDAYRIAIDIVKAGGIDERKDIQIQGINL